MQQPHGQTATPALERLDRILERFTELTDAVAPDQWNAATPCTSWRTVELVGHMTDCVATLADLIAGKPWPDAPSSIETCRARAGDDPAGNWRAALNRTRPLLAANLHQTIPTPFGDTQLVDFLDGFFAMESLVHTADLGLAIRIDPRLNPRDVGHVTAFVAPLDDQLRGPSSFRPAVEPPLDADETGRLLAFLGRRLQREGSR